MSKKNSRYNVHINRYEGGNETIDRLRDDDEELWIVNAGPGRKVLILTPGSSEDDAWQSYQDKWLNADAENEPVEDEEDAD